jgi:uncharacterized protein YciI|tara:strand:- start:81 stop:239 length:159 start_codon:yes stop_codon:yes gene_type:complete
MIEQQKVWIIEAESEEEAQEIAEEAEPKTVRMLHCIDVETVWETKDVTPGQE